MDRNKLLYHHVEMGDITTIRELIKNGADVNVMYGDNKETILHLLCDIDAFKISYRDRFSIFKLFLISGAKHDGLFRRPHNDTPLIIATKSKLYEFVNTLVRKGCDLRYQNKNLHSALHIAVINSAPTEILEMLYHKSIDLSALDYYGDTLLCYVIRNLLSLKEVRIHSLLENNYASRIVNAIKFLLNNGVDINSYINKCKDKALHEVCIQQAVKYNDMVEIMVMLLELGLDVNVRNRLEETPLHCSARYQPKECNKLLLKYNADVNAKTKNGSNVLHYAALNKHIDVLEMFIKRNVEIDAKSTDASLTPLAQAVWKNRSKNARLLMEYGADVNKKIMNNQIVLHIGMYTNNYLIVCDLLEYGSDINAIDNYYTALRNMAATRNPISEVPDEDKTPRELARIGGSISSSKVALIKHITRLVYTDPTDTYESLRSPINNDARVYLFERCIEELKLLEQDELIKDISLLKILRSDIKKLPSYIRNATLVKTYKRNEAAYGKKYPIYFDSIKFKMHLYLRHKDQMIKVEENLIKLVSKINKSWKDIRLPALVLERIVNYLSPVDISNLADVFD